MDGLQTAVSLKEVATLTMTDRLKNYFTNDRKKYHGTLLQSPTAVISVCGDAYIAVHYTMMMEGPLTFGSGNFPLTFTDATANSGTGGSYTWNRRAEDILYKNSHLVTINENIYMYQDNCKMAVNATLSHIVLVTVLLATLLQE